MNEITRNTGAANAVAAIGQLRQGLQNVKQTLVVKGGDPFLKLDKKGRGWMYGQDNAEVGEGSLWAVNPFSLQHGFIAWPPESSKDRDPLGEVMVPLTSPLPDRASLANVGAEWDQQFSFQLKCVEGDDEGVQTVYKVTSAGGTNAVDKLIAALMAQLDDDPEHPVPVIELEQDSYLHKKWGETFVPVFRIDHWRDMSGAESTEPELPLDKPEPAPEPAKRTRRTKAEMEAAKSVPSIPQREADDTVAVPSIEELEALIAKRKAEAAAPVVQQEDPAAARRRALEAELAALNGGGQPSSPATPEPGQPIRRRRQ